MPAKIKLVLYGHARNSMPSLQGRSGQPYARAHFNEKQMRHETQDFDLDEFQSKILPDIVKFANPLRWWPVVTVEPAGDEVKRLTDELAAANMMLEHLTAEAAKSAPADPFASLSATVAAPTDAAGGPAKPLSDLKYRELRELCKERNISVTGSTTKDEMIAALSDPVELVATPEPAVA